MIDLRSDTATRPTAGMRAAIAAAAVGDEQKREDPTVNELEERAARAARAGGGGLPPDRDDGEPDRAAAAHRARRRAARRGELPRLHLRARRAGRPLRRRHARPAGRRRAASAPEQVRAAYRVPAIHSPRTRVALGREHAQRVAAAGSGRSRRSTSCARSAIELDLRFHLDGARLLNAAVASGIEAARSAGRFDTVTLCLSKGLGCPLGALLAGPVGGDGRARAGFKHLFGGAMRQAGIVAAAGVYALDHHVDRLADDHAPREAARARPRRGRAGGRPRPGRDELRPARRRAADEGGGDRRCSPSRASASRRRSTRPCSAPSRTSTSTTRTSTRALEAIPRALGARVRA